MHCNRMPPSSRSRSMISTSSAPFFLAAMAAASPPGPLPMTTTSYFVFVGHLQPSTCLVVAHQERGAAALLGDLQGRDAQLARQDIHHARHVKAAQAAPGAQPGAALDGVVGAGRDGGMDLRHDLTFGDHLAAANDAPIARIPAISLTCSSRLRWRKRGRAGRIGFHSGFSPSVSPASFSSSTTRWAMAGAAVRPGDSIPPRLTSPLGPPFGAAHLDDEIVAVVDAGRLAGSVAVGAQARRTRRWRGAGSATGSSWRALPDLFQAFGGVARSSLSSISWAVGPQIGLPCMVAVTRIPLLTSVGTGNSTLLIVISARSRTMYSPRRGSMRKFGRTPALCITSSEYSPAALTTQRQPKSPRLVLTPMMRSSSSRMKSSKAVPVRIARRSGPRFQPRRTVTAKGSQIPPVGAHSAPLTCGLMFGSRGASPRRR